AGGTPTSWACYGSWTRRRPRVTRWLVAQAANELVVAIADQDENADAVSARERLGGQRQQVAAVTRRADVAQRLATATRGCKPHFVGGARGRAAQHNGNLVVVRVVLASDQPHAAGGQCVRTSTGRAEPARIGDAAQAC